MDNNCKNEDRELSRRGFLEAGGTSLLLLLASCAPLSPFPQNSKKPSGVAQTNYERKQVKLEDQITQEEIEALMERGSVDGILREEFKAGTIEHLVYNSEKPEESAETYKRFVFQEDKKAEERKPVLVMFYDKTKNEKDPSRDDFSLREAIISKEVKRMFGNEVKLLAFNVDIESRKTAAPYGTPLQKQIGIFVGTTPAIAMYGPFDLLKGECEQQNNGKIKHLDTLNGGPKTNKAIPSWLYEGDDSICEWIKTNATKPNGYWVMRLDPKPQKRWYSGK